MPRQAPSLRARALRYLAQREHSRVELRRKLLRDDDDVDAIDALLDELERARLLSDARFAQSLVHRRQARYGNARIAQELATHALDAQTTAQALRALESTELARALAVWERRFGVLPRDAAERARQSRFLTQRGFTAQTVRAVLRAAGGQGGAAEDDDD
jgi:regulatory protein